MRNSILIPLGAALGLALALPTLTLDAQADGRAKREDILPVSKVKKGMKGYGLTVFEGSKPERFDVEVIDVLSNFKPRQELILVKTKHPRLEIAKIVGGMSGSPIYLEGKMIGAYAYGWSFGVEPVAGVTPIRSMLDDLERPLPKMLHGLPMGIAPRHTAQPAESTGRFSGKLSDYSLDEHARQLADGSASARQGGAYSRLLPVSTPLLMGGLSSDVLEVARKYLEPLGLSPVQAGGGGKQESQGTAEGYVDGGAIGVNLVGGDISAMGLGTVTRVEGQRLVAFGHPMMNVGITSLPTTEARILWFMASHQRSFKMGEATFDNGALVNDREASIVVDQKAEAPRVAVEVHVRGEPGAPYDDWTFDVAHDRFLTPSLLGMAVGNGINTTAAERRDVTWEMVTHFEFDGIVPIDIYDIGSSPTGTPTAPQVMQSDAIEALGQVFNNPWQYTRLSKVRVDVELKFERDVARIRGIQLLTPEVDPGSSARLRITFEPYDGPLLSKTYSVPIPARFAGEEVKIQIRPGYMIEPVVAAPESLSDLVANFGSQPKNPKTIAFSYATGEGGAAYRGKVAENLPPHALDRLSSTSSSMTPDKFSPEEHHFAQTSQYLVGSDSVDVKVRTVAR